MRPTALLVLVLSLALVSLAGCRRGRGGGRMPPPTMDAGGGDGGTTNCNVVGCPPPTVCNTGTGVCEGMPGDCNDTGCTPPLTCNTVTGMCEGGTTDCTVTGCTPPQTCSKVTGMCESPPMCPPETVAPQSGGCDMATITCILGGTDPNTCVSMDSNPALCVGCLDNNTISCANDNGCQDLWNPVACCRDDNCGGTLDMACTGGACAAEWNPYFTCVMGVATTCASAITDCGGV